MSSHRVSIAVQPEDVDELGHVNNVVYLRWVQDAATAHWRADAPASAQEEIAWVVLRHEIDYQRPALPGDTVEVLTWVGQAEGATFERFTEIRRAGGPVLARARTIWCPVDPGTGRPARVSETVRKRFSVEP